MYKLIIMIPPQAESSVFEEGWPEFLHHAEGMPGLIREATARIDSQLFGNYPVSIVHELFFENLEMLRTAMSSPEGLATGEILQRLTHGQMTLLIAEHHEDQIENLKRYGHAE